MKVLVTGSRGMLGSDLMEVLASRGHEPIGVSSKDFDITDLTKTLEAIRGIKPEVVIHCAAMTDVDGCEKEPERAFRVNGQGTSHVAMACKESRARLIYISTDYVFDGRKGRPYEEGDEPHPINAYGKSKLMGERAIYEAQLKDYIILRTSWLYGLRGKNFIETILRLSQSGQNLKVVHDQVGSPTYTRDLAEGIEPLLSMPFKGILNLTNSGHCSWFELTRAILEEAGIDGVSLEPITSVELDRPAKRPPYSGLCQCLYQSLTGKTLRPWREALREYLARRGIKSKRIHDE